MNYFRPEAVEGYIRCLVGNISLSLAQIESRAYPQYDGNCMVAISEYLLSLANTREEQPGLDPEYKFDPIEINGRRVELLDPRMTIQDLLWVKKFVAINQ